MQTLQCGNALMPKLLLVAGMPILRRRILYKKQWERLCRELLGG